MLWPWQPVLDRQFGSGPIGRGFDEHVTLQHQRAHHRAAYRHPMANERISTQLAMKIAGANAYMGISSA
jgi:hypothetical protein